MKVFSSTCFCQLYLACELWLLHQYLVEFHANELVLGVIGAMGKTITEEHRAVFALKDEGHRQRANYECTRMMVKQPAILKVLQISLRKIHSRFRLADTTGFRIDHCFISANVYPSKEKFYKRNTEKIQF